MNGSREEPWSGPRMRSSQVLGVLHLYELTLFITDIMIAIKKWFDMCLLAYACHAVVYICMYCQTRKALSFWSLKKVDRYLCHYAKQLNFIRFETKNNIYILALYQLNQLKELDPQTMKNGLVSNIENFTIIYSLEYVLLGNVFLFLISLIVFL